ncbi:MAG: cadherin-like domain-containing protein [candidate division KSB1 bacterium]|nr:cadherin-like domain-containing protein [candidate division KSB1 bacterium]
MKIAAPGILANDTDPDGDALAASLVATVSHGSLSLSSDGSFSHVPDVDFSGCDSFTHRAYDGTDYSGITTVTIDVTSPEGTFGLNAGNATGSPAAGRLVAMRFQNNAGGGKLIKLEILFNDTTPAGRVRLGVYADSNGTPGALLLDAGEVAVANAWVAVSGLNLPVTPGTYYLAGL